MRKFLQAHFNRSSLHDIRQRGFTVIEFAIAMAISAIVVVGVSQMIVFQSSARVRLDRSKTAQNLRAEILDALIRPEAVTRTINDPLNLTLDCIRLNQKCTSGGTIKRLYDRSGKLIFPVGLSGDSNGWSNLGTECVTFTETSGDDNCPFQAHVSWTQYCDAACADMQIKWDVQILNRPANKGNIQINEAALAFAIYTNQAAKAYDQISAGTDFTCIRFNASQVKCWGKAENGELGRSLVWFAPSSPDVALVLNSTLSGPLTGVDQLSSGDGTICAKLNTGEAICWGEGYDGQMGNGRAGPAEMHVHHIESVVNTNGVGALQNVQKIWSGEENGCALDTFGAYYCWGKNQFYIMSNPNPLVQDLQNLPPYLFMAYPVPGLLKTDAVAGTVLPTGILDFATGSTYQCFILAPNREVTCWGNPEHPEWPGALSGIPGVNTPAVVSINMNPQQRLPGPGVSRRVDAIALGSPDNLQGVQALSIRSYVRGCALLQTGEVVCWGKDSAQSTALSGVLASPYNGGLGRMTPPAYTYPEPIYDVDYVLDPAGAGHLQNIVQLNVSWDHTCALDKSGDVWCWGSNINGTLGDGTTAAHNFPVKALLPAPAKELASGNFHNCALLGTSEVWCWGLNQWGQLGIGVEDSLIHSTPEKTLGL